MIMMDDSNTLSDNSSILDVKINESTDFIMGSIQRFQNLENLFLGGFPGQYYGSDIGWYGPDFGLGIDLDYIRSLGKVKILLLKDFWGGNYIGEQEMDLIFQNFDFEALALHRCSLFPTVPLQNLTTLTTVHCHYLEIVVTSAMAESLRNLKRMRVVDCVNLREVIEDQVQLQNLEVLFVLDCFKLISVTPPPASVSNLTILHVSLCNSLEFILTYTFAKSLEKLENMHVRSCYNVREVIQHEVDQIEEEIIFHHLQTLKLEFLMDLRSFCTSHFALELPVLEELLIVGSWGMKSFCHGHLILPNSLQQVEIDERRYKLHGDNNLNTLIRKLQQEEEGTY